MRNTSPTNRITRIGVVVAMTFGVMVGSTATADQSSEVESTAATSEQQIEGSPAGFVGLTPHRVLDTRTGIGTPAGELGPASTIDVSVTDVGGVPSGGVDTVVINVAVSRPTTTSYITVWPTGVTRPTAANLNMVEGQTFANLVFAKVGADGKISIYNNAGTTHVIADIVGYIPNDVGYVGVTPTRVLDTRNDTGPNGGRRPAKSLTLVTATDATSLPADGTVRSVVLNVTAVSPDATSFITAFEWGLERPLAAHLNTRAGLTIPNLIVQKVDSATGRLWLYNDAGSTHLVADVVGYFTVDATYFGLEPNRVLDTRSGVGQTGPQILGPGETLTLDMSGVGNLETWPGSVAFNVTAVRPTGHGFLTVWPGGARPTTASLNFAPGDNIPNLVVSKVGADGTISIYNSSGSTHVVADLLGWFAETSPAASGGCQARNADATMTSLVRTKHFAAWWGGTTGDADRLRLAAERALLDMELARTNAVEKLGMPEAPGNPFVCANVYIGQTGGSSDDGGPGVGTDSDGFPFMVMPASVVDGFADTVPAANVAGVEYTQHEAFHLFQYNSVFEYSGESIAWIEGTADWFTRYTYPDDQGGRVPVSAYLRYPHDALWSSSDSLPDDAERNDTRGSHPYGASWFFVYLTQYAGADPAAISAGFAGADPDPWLVLDAQLSKRSIDIGTEFGVFAARNATLDWRPVDTAGIEDGHVYQDTFSSPDFRIAASHPGAGTGGFVAAPAATAPAGFGWNTITLTSDRTATYTFDFDGDALGSEGAAATFEVHAIVRSGDTRTYRRLSLDGSNIGAASISAMPGDEVFLVVAAVPDLMRGNQTYGYRYRITPAS